MWSRVLHVKLIVPELVKKFDAFNGTQRLIPTFTRAHACPYPATGHQT